MATVNNFERDLDYKQHRQKVFRRDANEVYTYDGSSEDLIHDSDRISDFLRHHLEAQRPRLDMLNDYYEGLNFNLMRSKRRREKHMADNRVSHDYAAYITDFINGYFLGNPIQIDTEDSKVAEELEILTDINDLDSHNRSIGLDLSIFGRAFEYIIRNQDDEIRVYKSDARNTFVIYDTSIEQNSLVAIRYWLAETTDQQEDIYNVDVITPNATYFYRANVTTDLKLEERKPAERHMFGRVTITEFRNNEKRRGDFEKVVPLIDLYDNAQVDTANYMTDLNDAMLLVKGNVDLSDENVVDLQKEANMLQLEPPEYETDEGKVTEGKVDAGYIYKEYDVQGSEAYKDRINANIHMFTNTPDMSDEKFSGQQSGEAMKYKLFGLEQRTAIKEGLFKKGLRRRYKLIEEMLKLNSELERNKTLRDLSFTFNRNLPKSLIENIQAVSQLTGLVSDETKLSLLSFVDDPKAELERMEQEEARARQQADQQEYGSAFAQDETGDVND
ncbi:phage portal protein [Staphylococcus arlettae]|uniref:phage portal protein n=1 Tax=Staphylococcus arlettae TaxID=29378 RepID=UPI0021CE8674|nr:phage portal protein [Staphylococcus arlettae]UXU53202.1 phage portal protein [Staphylococcus arlettae]